MTDVRRAPGHPRRKAHEVGPGYTLVGLGRALVALVGAGPGDPGLLTVRGRDLLALADVVVYDRLVDPRIVAHAPAQAELIYAGKGPKGHAMEQDEINDLLVEVGQQGKAVVRLKGGDPFVFGRGGEEASALARAGIPFEVVPGVSSAIAAPAYAGIPVTDRRYASSVAFVTGREGDESSGGRKPWRTLAGRADTLVVLMGLGALREIVADLTDEGLPFSTPAALVHRGTTPGQRTVTGTLGTIVERSAGVESPAAFIVGGVVDLASTLGWFESRPLFGMRVAVTRSRGSVSGLAARLADLGADPVELPTIAFGPPDDFSALDRALATAGAFDWAVFASPTSVEYVLGRLGDLGGDARSFAGVRIAAVGPATAKALARRGLLADLTSPVATTPGLLEALASEGLTGARLLLPRTDIADDALPEGLERLGASVERVTAYRTSPPPGLEDAARVALARGLDLVCYSSSSTVNNLVASLGTEAGGLASVPSACIGPATADAARTAGLVVAVEAREHTIPGLIDAILEWRSRGGGIGS